MLDERTIVSRIAGIIKTLSDFNADLEEHIIKGIKRLDLIFRYKGNTLFNGEFKRPTILEGKSPRNSILIEDAYIKSNRLNPPAHFFITSNFNETIIIWDNRDTSRPLMESLERKEKAGESMNGFVNRYINLYFNKNITKCVANAIQTIRLFMKLLIGQGLAHAMYYV